MRGLRVQLALFYLALSIPALMLIEHVSLAFEFERCLEQLDDGRIQRVLEAEASALSQALRVDASEIEIELRLQRLVLQLERPRESLGTAAAYVLLELAEHPFHAAVVSDGREEQVAGGEISRDPDFVHRHWSAPLQSSTVRVGGRAAVPSQLTLDLSVPSPWRRFGDRPSFEWPIAVSYLVLFLLGSAWFLRRRVLVRIGRMGEAARAWAGGDFSSDIADRGRDELGLLAGDLDRMAADLKALVNARAQLATLEERRRLARDLHDTVKQKVFALSLQLAAAREGAADSERSGQRLLEAITLVEEIQRELSDQLRELSEVAGAAEDLVPALERRLADFERRSGCAIRHDLPASLEVPPTQAETVLRIVDEALANVLRHAAATRIDVMLATRNGDVELAICDDGRGGVRESSAGMGLSNMRHRTATLVGGTLSFEPRSTGGTCVRLVFDAPLPPDRA